MLTLLNMRRLSLLAISAVVVVILGASLVAIFRPQGGRVPLGQGRTTATAAPAHADIQSTVGVNASSSLDTNLKNATASSPPRALYTWVPISEQNPNMYETYIEEGGKIYVDGSNALISSADALTFQVASGTGAWDFARDKNYVYVDGGVIRGADPKTFTLLYTQDGEFQGYGKDNDHVFFFWGMDSPYLVRGADPATFKVVGTFESCPDARDKDREYCRGNPFPSSTSGS